MELNAHVLCQYQGGPLIGHRQTDRPIHTGLGGSREGRESLVVSGLQGQWDPQALAELPLVINLRANKLQTLFYSSCSTCRASVVGTRFKSSTKILKEHTYMHI